MASYKQNTKLMAKNSAFMYIQMAVKMLIGLYTVRVVLHALGAEDYGIYNVVGGFVTMFTFVTSSLVSASQRFFAYAIGKNDFGLLNRYFNTAIISFLLISIIAACTIEIIGYWFVNYKLVIPTNRLSAASWILHFSILAFAVRILAVPFSALLVAHEKMFAYALIHVLDSLLLLGVAFMILNVHFDRLKFYAFCMFAIALVNSTMYIFLCRHSYRESSTINFVIERPLLKELLNYCSLYMLGTMALVVRSQGINIMLNIFFNPTVNAARAIAYQINNAINQFVNSFYQAVRPQITKLVAVDEKDKMLSLVISTSVISYLLMSLIAIPLLVEMPFVLSFWLGNVPKYTIIFSRLVIVTAMVDTLGNPLTTAVCASGNIRNFQVLTGMLLMLNLPISYFLLLVWSQPYLVFYVSIGMSIVVLFARLLFMKHMYGMQLIPYFYEVFLKMLFITILALILSYLLTLIFSASVLGHMMVILLSLIIILLLSWFWGMKKTQRDFVQNIIKRYFHRR